MLDLLEISSPCDKEDRIVRLNTTTEKKIYPVGDSSVSMMMIREEPIQEKVILLVNFTV